MQPNCLINDVNLWVKKNHALKCKLVISNIMPGWTMLAPRSESPTQGWGWASLPSCLLSWMYSSACMVNMGQKDLNVMSLVRSWCKHRPNWCHLLGNSFVCHWIACVACWAGHCSDGPVKCRILEHCGAQHQHYLGWLGFIRCLWAAGQGLWYNV